ncbi:IQ domain-containing protein E-like isoform X2 [Ruditapes philippinarum]|uniref:IQ domain-containing protein E-like isoform X2 n=1 Tax=Ruditapes philippinarum TaxID=129788 RepID=UPI00295B0B50|nr:IQ domain-containing protein E-like isoform X2 [Ruditapes philippinarum]
MPGKYKSKYGDDYESDDLETTDTLIGRNRVPSSPVKKNSRPVSGSAKKRTPRRPVTPGKKKKRPQSAPAARTGHDLWMNAVKQRLTVGLASNRHPTSPRHKTVSEYWIDTLRKTGTGFTTESTGMNTFSGKRPRDKDMPYLSTPAYLRQMAGTERQHKANDPMSKASPGTPAYKSQEEYYEQILEYKKQVGALNQDANNMKAKIRRLEEDNLKKEKEIDSLLNPQKSEELRRTLADKRPDSGSVIHSLKQKILKLETQMRDKETAYIKLQSDLKTTKVDEMKQQMEVFYNEIIRLQHSKDTGMNKTDRPTGREGSVKVKALNETILRLNKTNEHLQSENRSLKDDLKNALENTGGRPQNKDYEDMGRKELLQCVTQLEKRLEKSERHMDGSSIISYESKANHVQGKIALDGSLEDRLDQLDKRESELLELLEKKNDKIKQLTAEKNRWKKRCEEMEKMVGSGTADYDYRMDERTEKGSRSSRPPSARTTSTRGQRPTSARSDDRPPTARDRTPRGRPDRPDSGRSEKRPVSAKRRPSLESSVSVARRQKIRDFQENRSAKTIQRHWKSHRQDQQKLQNEKVEHFRENRAAKKIQHQWTGYQFKKHEHERDEASDLIRSALMGHTTRRQQMAMYEDDTEDDYMTDNKDYNDCVNLIQSSLMGHQQRRSRMKDFHLSSTGEEEDDDDDIDIMQSPKRRLSSSVRSNRPPSPSIHRSRPTSGKSRASISSASGKGSSAYSSSYKGRGTYSTHLDDDDDF